MPCYDIIIVGGGIVGVTAAIALAKQTSLNIALLDAQTVSPSWLVDQYDHRVSAISLASKRIFQNIHVWERMNEKRMSSYANMHVWDANGSGQIHFNAQEIQERTLGFIVEDNVMRTSLWEAAREHSHLHIIHPIKLVSVCEKSNMMELTTDNEQTFSAKLLIAADGANSWIREQFNIQLKTWDYEHTAIVATVQTELSHQQTAWQRFLKTGPLAFLPLNTAQHCSIVWSTSHDQAEKLLKLDDDSFRISLGEAFEHQLGDILKVEKRFHFSLRMRHANHYVLSRLALVGDAAHTIHPLAGQGVNLGLLDVACLVDVIIDAVKKGRDFTSLTTLRRYERWRKGDNLAMLAMVEMLKQSFMSDKASLQIVRNAGLNFTNKMTLLKKFFMNYAVGNRSDLPRLAQ